MNPKHTNPTREDRTAYAPYNFIPLPEAIVPAESLLPSHDTYYSDRFTGYIECTLETKSPVYTRTALDLDFFQRWADNIQRMMQNPEARETYAQFFHLDDIQRPVIPGSSLRGMVRSLVEIVGYGKVKWVPQTPLIFRAVGDPTSLGTYYRERFMHEDKSRYFTPKVRAGYMRHIRGEWFIQPAKIIQNTTFARIRRKDIPKNLPRWHSSKNAHRIWVRLGDYAYQKVRGGFIHVRYCPVLEAVNQPTQGYQEAVLAVSGKMNKKQREAVIFPPDETAELLPLTDEQIFLYREQITQEQQRLLGKNGVLKDYQPVFYLIENGKVIFFGHTWLFRLPYERSPLDIVPESLRDEILIDLAESIFGSIPNQKRKSGWSGRVFFTDAVCEPNQSSVWDSGVVIPKILSSPKPTTFQHYLTQQEPDPVDSGKRTRDGRIKWELRLDHYASPPPHPTTLRGHKLYWHKGARPDFAEPEPVNWQQDTQHTQIKPVRPGVRFRFRVYFENLSEVELGALLWVLDLPEKHYHKIGMGKPLGLGAVEIRSRLILTDRQARYQRLFAEEGWATAEHEENDLDQFKEAFEHYVLQRMDKSERGTAQRLTDVKRIQRLLTMLKWPGPDPEHTRYMELSEFRNRPVLPDPLAVAGNHLRSTAPQKQESIQPKSHPSDIPLLTAGDTVSAMIEGEWKKGEIKVKLPGGQKGKLKISKKKFQSLQTDEVKVKIIGRKGSYYKVELVE